MQTTAAHCRVASCSTPGECWSMVGGLRRRPIFIAWVRSLGKLMARKEIPNVLVSHVRADGADLIDPQGASGGVRCGLTDVDVLSAGPGVTRAVDET